jgi:hypothetical protein
VNWRGHKTSTRVRHRAISASRKSRSDSPKLRNSSATSGGGLCRHIAGRQGSERAAVAGAHHARRVKRRRLCRKPYRRPHRPGKAINVGQRARETAVSRRFHRSLISLPARGEECRGSGAYREVCTWRNAWPRTPFAEIGRRRRVDPWAPRRLCAITPASKKDNATSGRGMP